MFLQQPINSQSLFPIGNRRTYMESDENNRQKRSKFNHDNLNNNNNNTNYNDASGFFALLGKLLFYKQRNSSKTFQNSDFTDLKYRCPLSECSTYNFVYAKPLDTR